MKSAELAEYLYPFSQHAAYLLRTYPIHQPIVADILHEKCQHVIATKLEPDDALLRIVTNDILAWQSWRISTLEHEIEQHEA